MPTAAEQLTPTAGVEEAKAAIASCISQMAAEHPDWDNDRCVAACHSMAETARGSPLPQGGVGQKTTRRITG